MKTRMMGSTQRSEWTWVIVVTCFVVTASAVPYLAGYVGQTAEWRFGGALLDQVDYHTYLAKMWQGFRGEWQYQVPFTTENHAGAYLVTFYIALGHVARLTKLGLPLTYQLARILFAFLMLLSIYRFIALFIAPVRTRRVAFLLATLASGLGWLTQIFAPTPTNGVSPMDFWFLDGFTYLALLVVPHFCAAIGLLLTIFVLLLRRPEGPDWRDGGLALLASLALGIIHPYTLLVADLVPLFYWGTEALRTRRVNWRGVITVAAMGISQLPLLVYDLWVFRQPVFAGWSAQNVTLSPPPRIYLWGYGVLLVLGAVGTVAWARQRRQGLAFPLIWIALVAVLSYLPWNLQRRFLEGVQVPLGMLAGVGVAEGLFAARDGKQVGRLGWVVMGLLIALTALSNLYLTAGYTLAAATRSPYLFWSADVVAGVDWLGENTSPEDTVLASFEVGNLIPAHIGHRVVLGHWMETVDYERKEQEVARFFDVATPHAERIALLERYGADYVFFGPDERALGAFDPAEANYLAPMFVGGDARIYRVVLDGR